uniref:Diaminopimelate decarboxylase n=1 Tax=Globisporangium ultimum (strain ATCC 200006 / CBS 805.95 / DAOM BR144) TaxID=431595 RepID=K3W613_GLOUD
MPLPLRDSTKQNLAQLAETYGTPLQIYDEQLIRDNARKLLATFRKHFPDFQQFFAVKALPNPAILKVLHDEGCGMDCSSSAELYSVQQLGIPGDQVIFTSNFTSKADLATAFDQGVIMNLDDVSLVDSLVAIRGRCPELMSFRLNPGLGRTDSETKSNVLGGPDAKFGVPPFQIVEAYRKAKAAGATRFGIHMMTGSCVMNQEYWKETVTVLFDTIVTLKKDLGIEFEFMNIGGGLGIPYRPDQETVDIESISQMLRDVFDEAMRTHGLTSIPRLCMENGRFMTGPFGWLVTRCEAIKETYGLYYGVDACMAHLMRPGMYGSYHHITIPAREDQTERPPSHVVGTLCENNDWFAKDRPLPRAQVGDLFVIHDTGAHSHSMGFQYNGKLRAPEILIRPDGKDTLIRQRETYDALYGNCILPDDL